MLQRLDNLAGAIGTSILSRVSGPPRIASTAGRLGQHIGPALSGVGGVLRQIGGTIAGWFVEPPPPPRLNAHDFDSFEDFKAAIDKRHASLTDRQKAIEFNAMSRQRALEQGHDSWEEFEVPDAIGVKVLKTIGLLLARILGALFGIMIRLMRSGLFRR